MEQRQADLNVLFDSVYSKVDAVIDVPHSNYIDAFVHRWPEAKVKIQFVVIYGYIVV